MEDDTIRVSPRRVAPTLAALFICLAGGGVVCPAAAQPAPRPLAPLPLSPLPALGGPGPLLAQAALAPGAPAAGERIVAEPGAPPGAPAPPQPKLGDRCRADGDCPRETLCIEGTCQRPDKRVSALFYFHQKGPAGYRVVVPFYFSFWRPSGQTRMLLPFFADVRDSERKSRDLVLPPLLYQYHRDPGQTAHRVWPIFFYSNYGARGSAVGLLPLFFGARRDPETLAVLPPLLSFYHANRERGLRQLLVAGLVYSRRERERHTLVIPPLLSFFHSEGKSGFGSVALLGWYRRTPERTAGGLFPLAWYLAGPKGHTTVVLPLWVESEDRERGLRHMTLLPLFHYRREDGGKRRLLVTPLGGYHRDDESGTTVSALLVPPLVHRETPQQRLTVLPPLGLWFRDRATGRALGYAGPIFWSIDRAGSTSGFLPFYFHFHNRRAQATTDVLLPIGVLHRAPGRVLGALGPVYFWSRCGEGSGFGIFPVLWTATGRRSYGLLLPLFAYVADADAGTRHVSLGPLFWRQRQRGPEAGYDAGALPLLFIGRRGAASYQALLPLFLHSRTPRQEQFLFGPLYVSRRFARQPGDPQAGWSATLFPVLWAKHSAAQSYGVVPPLLFLGRDGRRWTAAVPPLLLFVRSGPGEQLAFGPLFFYKRDARRTSLLVGPYAYFDRPEAGGRATTHAVLPLAFFHRAPGRSAQVIFPLFLQASEGGTTVRSVALAYWGVSRPDLGAHVLLPLFARAVTDKSSTTVLGPAFFHRRHDGSALGVGLLPVFGYGRDARTRVFASPVGFYYHDQKLERTRTAFFLFYGDFQRGRGDWGLLPLLFGWRRGTTTSWLVPFIFHSDDPAQQRTLTVVGPLFFGRRGAATFGGLAPLFFGRNSGDGSYRFTAVPLFHVDHREGKLPTTRLFTPLFGFIKNPAGFRAYLLSAYLRRDADVRSEALLPLFYHSLNRVTQSRTLLVLPLLFRATSPESTLTAVTPLLWQYTSLTRRTLLMLPLFLDDHTLFQKRLTAAGPLVPLVIRERDYAEGTTTWIFPPLLTYVKKHAAGHDAAIFPIFWHFRNEERTTTLLLPVAGYMRRPDYRAAAAIPFFFYYRDDASTTWLFPPLLTYYKRQADGQRTAIFFPLLYHRSGPDHSRTIFFPLLWYARTGDQRTVITPLGGYRRTDRAHQLLVLNVYVTWGIGPRAGAWGFHFWPLFSFGRPRRGDLEWHVLGGLLGYTRLGIERTLQLLWFIPVPLDPVGRPSAWYGATLRMSGAREW